jgi:hypothetical protein
MTYGSMEHKLFVLSDQAFPPLVPPEATGGCVSIYRIELATLMELARLFVDLHAGASGGAGVVVSLHSLTHLAVVGLAAYTEDLVRAARLIQEKCEGVQVVAGAPLLMGDAGDAQLARSLFEMAGWVSSLRDFRERSTAKTWKSLIEVLKDGGEEDYSTPPVRHRLPVGITCW